MYDERVIRRVADNALNKRRDRNAKRFAAILSCICSTLIMAFGCMITFFYGVEEGYVGILGFILGQCSWGVGLTVYYAVYEHRRYKF